MHTQQCDLLPTRQLHIGGLNILTDRFTHFIIWPDIDFKRQAWVNNISHINVLEHKEGNTLVYSRPCYVPFVYLENCEVNMLIMWITTEVDCFKLIIRYCVDFILRFKQFCIIFYISYEEVEGEYLQLKCDNVATC